MPYLHGSTRAEFPQKEQLVLFVKRHPEEGIQVVVYHLLHERQQLQVLAAETDRSSLRVQMEGGMRVRSNDSVVLCEFRHVAQLCLCTADGELNGAMLSMPE